MTYSQAYGLGEVTNEELFNQLITIARQNFPNETAKAEAWLKEQAIRYGIVTAKDLGQQVLASPLTWLAGGLLVGWLAKK
jgi:hypothetical protein